MVETYVRELAGVAVVPEHVHVAARINARVEQTGLQQRRGDARIGEDLEQRVAMLGGQRPQRVVVQVGVSVRGWGECAGKAFKMCGENFADKVGRTVSVYNCKGKLVPFKSIG